MYFFKALAYIFQTRQNSDDLIKLPYELEDYILKLYCEDSSRTSTDILQIHFACKRFQCITTPILSFHKRQQRHDSLDYVAICTHNNRNINHAIQDLAKIINSSQQHANTAGIMSISIGVLCFAATVLVLGFAQICMLVLPTNALRKNKFINRN
jgi:hypothetical protein